MKTKVAVFSTVSIRADGDDDEYPPETPTCAVRCALIVDVICAGPVSGCGKLKSFNNPCMLGGWNCNHPSHRKFYI